MTTNSPEQQRKRSRGLVWGIGAAVILIGSVGLVALCGLFSIGFNNLFAGLSDFGGEGGLTEVEVLPDRFMLYMAYGDTERAYALLSSYGRDNFSEGDLQDFYAQYEPMFTEYERLGFISPQSSTARSLANPSATFGDVLEVIAYEVDTTVYYDGGQTASIRFIVGPEDDRWLIDFVEITP